MKDKPRRMIICLEAVRAISKTFKQIPTERGCRGCMMMGGEKWQRSVAHGYPVRFTNDSQTL